MNGPPYAAGGAWPPAPAPATEMDLGVLEPVAEREPFEPLPRARSNTWPLPRPEGYAEPPADGGAQGAPGAPAAAPLPAPKKNSSRRNAWGNLSYADLITQAITTSPDKRLTLSQIYEWMVQNVPYFKDKGDSNSSAGWKNSIRHNLSLHNRFMRVQNEGTGKSSWWMINPDAKPGKSVRRRAVTMETSKFEKRRGRVKKKVEMIRNGLPDTTPSPTSSVSEGLDLFPDSPLQHSGGNYQQLNSEFRPRASSNPSVFSGGNTFQLSPGFRPRTNSNTSSCGGRLSPIPSAPAEGEWTGAGAAGRYAGPAPGGYSPPEMGSAGRGGGGFSADDLAGNLEQGMKLQPDYMGLMINGQTTQAQPPPPYSSPFDSFRDFGSMHTTQPYNNNCPVHRGMQSCHCIRVKVERMSPTGMSPTYAHSEPSPDPLAGHFIGNPMSVPTPSSNSPPLTPQSGGQGHSASTMMGQFIEALNSSSGIITDDLNINVDSLQGGFDCNVEELIKHELRMEGSLDFNFGGQQQAAAAAAAAAQQQQEAGGQQTGPPPPYGAVSAAVTAPSYVH